jgi:hypothetical protein
MVDRNIFKSLVASGTRAGDIARDLGITRQRVHQIAKQMGLVLPPPPKVVRKEALSTPRSYKSRAPLVITGGVQTHLNSKVAGKISELLVATDLMARGWQIYFPLNPNSTHDLVATFKGNILSFEVRSAYRIKTGRLTYQKKSNSAANHYALVVTGEPIQYLPPLLG